MQTSQWPCVKSEALSFLSPILDRIITATILWPPHPLPPGSENLLLINDGQDVLKMNLQKILDHLYAASEIKPLLCVAIHAGPDRKMEYGVAGMPDFKGRGAKADLYAQFIIGELIPNLNKLCRIHSFAEMAIAGFSLGGLSAMDIALSYPDLFRKTGVFSGSLWWRNVDQTDSSYDDNQHRIIHLKARYSRRHSGNQFFFQCGRLDEEKDRNKNGIIDSIDDTLDLIQELQAAGYNRDSDIFYLELTNGRHDIATWATAMPEFLKWGWGA